MDETSKTLRLLTEAERKRLSGKGIDIGSGGYPVRRDVQPFDREHGDANEITRFVKGVGTYDYVFSSHCLEHMRDPEHALGEWWKLLKVGGSLIVVVPDEDLYEQGYWPSLFNKDHKFTFTIAKQKSWSPVSRNLLDLARGLPGPKIVSLRVQDQGYRRAFLVGALWPRPVARLASAARSIVFRVPPLRWLVEFFCLLLRLPIDQLWGEGVAQILLVAEKGSQRGARAGRKARTSPRKRRKSPASA